MDTFPTIDTLRLSRHQRDALLADLDRQGVGPLYDLRRSERYPFRDDDGLLIRISGGRATYRVRPRNLSERGIALLHGTFAYPGSPVALVLRDRDGGPLLVRGRIMRCRHTLGRVHELGIRFDRPIDVQAFVDLQAAVADAPPPQVHTPYPVRDIVRLSRRLQQQAAGGADRAELRLTLGELVRVLRPHL
jgi:hypothetical protein